MTPNENKWTRVESIFPGFAQEFIAGKALRIYGPDPSPNHSWSRGFRSKHVRMLRDMSYRRMLATWRQEMVSEFDEIYGRGEVFEFIHNGRTYPLERSLTLPRPMPHDAAQRYLRAIFPTADGWTTR